MNILIHPNSTVIKILLRVMTLLFHNTQVMFKFMMILSYSSLTIFLQQVAKILSHTGHWWISVSIIPRKHKWYNALEQTVLKCNNQQVKFIYRLPGIHEQCSFLCTFWSKCLEDWQENQTTCFLFGFRVSDFNFGCSNIFIISFFIGHLLAGKCLTKWDAISLFIPLNTQQRSAGCSTPDHAAFLIVWNDFILWKQISLMASICDKSTSHHAPAVNSSEISSPVLMLKSQYFLRCWLIPGTRTCSW